MSGYIPVGIPNPETIGGENVRAYKNGPIRIIISEDTGPVFGVMRKCLHLSISHPNRYPTWDEILDARNTLMPSDRDGYMIMPKKGLYVNVHPNCFHVWMPFEAGWEMM